MKGHYKEVQKQEQSGSVLPNHPRAKENVTLHQGFPETVAMSLSTIVGTGQLYISNTSNLVLDPDPNNSSSFICTTPG
jgi:hypothetical protein